VGYVGLSVPCTFVPTPWTLVCARDMDLFTPSLGTPCPCSQLAPLFLLQEPLSSPWHESLPFSLQRPSSMLTPYTFLSLRSEPLFVLSLDPPYCALPSALIPLVREIDSLGIQSFYNVGFNHFTLTHVYLTIVVQHVLSQVLVCHDHSTQVSISISDDQCWPICYH
jgi:hypothetical protein